MHATVSLFAALSVVVVSQATPYYLPQQRQLFYPVLPQYPQYPQYSQYSQYYPRQVYYSPPTAANLVAPVPAAVRYPVVAPAPAKSVVYYGAPALAPYPGNFVYAGGADEGAEAEGGSGWGSFFNQIAGHFPAIWGSESESPASGVEGGSAAEGGSSPANPEKIEASNGEESPKEGEENDKDKASETENPALPTKAQKVKFAPKGGLHKYVVLSEPQFFGNFGLHQRVNPAAVLPAANNGAVSSYLLLKNQLPAAYPGYRFGPQFPVVPQVPQVPQAADSADAEVIPAGHPGAAALGYQKLVKDAEAAREKKEYDDSVSVSVDDTLTQNDKTAEAAAGDTETDKNEEEETGTARE